MTTAGFGGLSARKKLFDIVVSPGTPQTVVPSALSFHIVAVATVAGAGTYSIDYSQVAAVDGVDDYRPTINDSDAANTGISNGAAIAARSTSIAVPGVQRLRFTATTQPTRFIAYGV